MGNIKGMEYSDTRYNEVEEEEEYFIDDWGVWLSEEDVKDRIEEEDYWVNDYPNEIDDERIDED